MAQEQTVVVPDIGDFKDVEIIEVLVKPGDKVAANDSLITLESDKAAMEIPSPYSGTVTELHVRVGSKVSMGTPILQLREDEGTDASGAASAPVEPAPAEPVSPPPAAAAPAAGDTQAVPASAPTPPAPMPVAEEGSGPAHASPAVRRFARELGVDVAKVRGTGPKGRILKTDVQSFVKQAVATAERTGGGGFAVPAMPEIDFAQFGPIERQPLSRIQKLSSANLHRTWLTVPHVTQHDEADITELEAFRNALKAESAKRGVKLTLLPFIIKAAVAALKDFPRFNASVAPNGEELILKRYYHVGFAVDTPDGLVVPVIRDADTKGIWDIAAELAAIGDKARGKKLRTADLQGGTFTVSSLGGIGGIAFTPIINAPEVAILGVSKAQLRPVFQDGQFVPRLMLPLSLSYDHRVIDGADGVRFVTHVSSLLADMRRVLL
ncbi:MULTISPECIES: dihydrolipoyllysine-residue acetyltransferase [Methylococcus]|jgi:pyruvate dehydrogenase E2 component (dihydrolipoamide acetyltransferase)|uniref:Acetyltransferase component of pyruvate dehydrogenase complex n=2 Tax=Methylococcus capsulatus TaxID=414 RepID=Q602R1_METCA|nr:dihydrolipoyllysine-residue acetyltransferase [Methylococcus capsulatus]AAU90978.1 pyruvate dehydrogenase complex, E2 component, dihydrolipoamide acetyltransferase [Methylococcus capsulatus str. Bath]QXP86600.1 dihydrolipoyllysine-residue acetyltransferase [Methylococcus capsulatus]QXP89124.1 dihydrolipoyllysine-residue acetyltransferase [Methylococcus capsulatus]QXP93721.1 dihydrolipoyllysine-residue acetyltransferase [Methylococcus capsulatus]UQN11560.1 dihydrolipoyllysine-residue acetylt